MNMKGSKFNYLEFLPLVILLCLVVLYFLLISLKSKILLIIFCILFLAFIISGLIIGFMGLMKYDLAKKNNSITEEDKFIKSMSMLNILCAFVVGIIIGISFITSEITGVFIIK